MTIRLEVKKYAAVGAVEVSLIRFYFDRVAQWFVLTTFIEGSGSDPVDEANCYVLQLKLMFEQLGIEVEVVTPSEVKSCS